MSTYNPFKSSNNSLFGNNNNTTNVTNNLFGNSNNTTNTANSLFGNNNNTTNTANSLFGNNNNTISTTSSIFGNNNNPTSTSNSLFGNINNNVNFSNASTFTFGSNQNQNQTNNTTTSVIGNNNPNSLFGQNNNNPISSLGQNNNQNQIGNLNGINNNNQVNNNINQNNQYLDLNNPKTLHDLLEYQKILTNIDNCMNPSKNENMFKDYLYQPIPKGKQPNEYNVYRPHTINKERKMVYINDYHIWEEGKNNNKNPNEYYPIQISSVEDLLNRNKKIESGLFKSISQTVETQKNLETLNKKIDDEMNNKLMELKNCHLKLDELELSLSSKVAQYNYLIGTAKENVRETQEIKDTIKKTNDNIKKNNMLELCEKIKKSSNENFGGESHNYIKDMNKEKINNMLDALVEIQNMMTIVSNNNKKNLDTLVGMQREVDRIFRKNRT
jgi:hypothetical protein